MKLFRFLQKWMRGACLWFTTISLCALVIGAMIPTSAPMLKITSFLLLFPFALSIAGANMLLRAGSPARWLRWLLHFGITLAAFLLFIWLPSNTAAQPATLLLLLVLFSVIYWILFLVIHTLHVRITRLLEED